MLFRYMFGLAQKRKRFSAYSLSLPRLPGGAVEVNQRERMTPTYSDSTSIRGTFYVRTTDRSIEKEMG